MRKLVRSLRRVAISIGAASLVLSFGASSALAQTATSSAVAATQEAAPAAQSAWMFRLRVLGVIPAESSTIGLVGGQVNLGNSFVPELDITYFFTPNVAAELILAVTKHSVNATGTAAGDIDLGHVWLLPPTLNLQYHFLPEGQFRPYLGAGVNYTVFFGEDSGEADAISYKNRFGFSLQGGMDVGFSKKWAVNFDIKKVFLSTDVEVLVDPTLVPADVTINPWIFGVGLAFRP